MAIEGEFHEYYYECKAQGKAQKERGIILCTRAKRYRIYIEAYSAHVPKKGL